VWEVETKLNVTICVNACTRENSHRGIMEFLARLGDNLIKVWDVLNAKIRFD